MRRIPTEAWLFVLILAVNVYAAITPANSLMMNWFSSDDAFYYFKTAQNISEGYGITFDRLGRDSGFHPLWMAICVPIFALARYDLILPLRIVIIVSGLLSAGTAVILYRMARRAISPPAAVLTALFFAFSVFIHNNITKLGLESPLSAFFLALLFSRVASLSLPTDRPDGNLDRRAVREMLLTGLVGALAILARLDNVFFVLAAGAWLVIHPRRARVLLALDLGLIVFGGLWSYFTRVGFGPHYAVLASSSYWMIAVVLAVRLPLYYFLRLYDPPKPGWKGLAAHTARTLAAAFAAPLIAGAIMLGLFALGAFPGFPRLVLAYEAGFSLAALLLTRGAAALLAFRVEKRDPTLPESISWRPTLTRGLAYALPVALLLGAYMAASLAYFDTPMPVSGQIKRWWGTLPNPIYGRPAADLPGLLGLSGKSRPWALLETIASRPKTMPAPLRYTAYALGAGMFFFLQRRRVLLALRQLSFLPIFTGAALHILSYTGTGYLHMRPWYWTGQILLITLLLGLCFDAVLETVCDWTAARVAGKPGGAWAWVSGNLRGALAFAFGAVIVIYGAGDLVRSMPLVIPPQNEEAYLGGMRELESATEPGAIIGSTGGGVVAYFSSNRTIVNMDGLMNTAEYFHRLQDGTASDYLTRAGLEYVYAGSTVVTGSDPYFQMKNHLVKIKDFTGITLFQWVP